MNENFFNSNSLTPAEYIKLMFEATNEGILHIPRFEKNAQKEPPDRIEAFIMNWNEDDMRDIISKTEQLIEEIRYIAKTEEYTLNKDGSEIYRDTAKQAIYDKYIAHLHSKDLDLARVQ